MRRLAVLGVGLLACLIALLATATQASAHAVVVSTTPGDGARLASAPSSVSIKFDEPVGLSLGYVHVVDSTGKRVDTGAASHPGGDDTSVSVAIKTGQGSGTYLVSWRVISADSHPVAGSVRFVVGNGALDTSIKPAAATVRRSVSVALDVSHFAGFAGLAMLGGSWLVFALWPSGRSLRRIRRLILSGWGLALAGAAGEFLVQGPYDSGGSIWDFRHSQLQQATMHSTTGELLSVRLLLLGLLGALLTVLLVPDEPVRAGFNAEGAALLGLGVVVTYAASGHSESADPRWFAVLVDALHLLAASAWLGGLAVLVLAAFNAAPKDDVAAFSAEPRADLAELNAAMPVFSRVALVSVATLTVTGTIQAWREVGVLDALWQTNYGRLVLAKIALFLVLIGLGYLARRHVLAAGSSRVEARHRVPALARASAVRVPAGPTLEEQVPGHVLSESVLGSAAPASYPTVSSASYPTVHRLRRTVLVELGLGAVVLALSGVLVSEPPGRAALDAEHAKPKITTVQVTSSSKAVVEVSPGRHGPVQVAVQLTGPLKPTSVTATASLPAKGLGPLPVPLQASGPNSYSASAVLLPSSGRWQLTISVQTSEFDTTTAIATVPLS